MVPVKSFTICGVRAVTTFAKIRNPSARRVFYRIYTASSSVGRKKCNTTNPVLCILEVAPGDLR